MPGLAAVSPSAGDPTGKRLVPLDTNRLGHIDFSLVTALDLRKLLRKLGCSEVRQVGSHLTIRCGDCLATIAVHSGDIPAGTLRKIERDLEPCLGRRWMQR